MPNLWTHLIFGQHALTQAGKGAWITDEPGKHMFNLGCQGPDFLFYHNFLPWKKSKHMNRIGSRMHQEHCGPVLLDMIHHMQGRESDDPSLLYVLGFVLHHILDRNMHPYVFYKSGFVKWNHQRFEVILDTIMVKKHLQLETWNTPAWKQIAIGDALPQDIVALFGDLTQRYYPDCMDEVNPGDWNQAYRDMISAQKLFHDPSGTKRALTMGQIEPLVYKKKNAPLDYANEAKAPWHDPTDDKQVYTYSVWELWDQAMEDALAVLEATFAVIRYGSGKTNDGGTDSEGFSSSGANPGEQDSEATPSNPREILAQKISNRSYETGKPVDSGLKIQFVDPII